MRKDGQAIVEFIAALVAVLVLFAALVEVAVLAMSRTSVMSEAREEAGLNAMGLSIAGPSPDYIAEWDSGADASSYSEDDDFTGGAILDLYGRLAAYAHPSDLSGVVGPNPVSAFDGDYYQILWGFERGHADTEIPLLPVVRDMIYADDSIEIESDVWMISTRGIY